MEKSGSCVQAKNYSFPKARHTSLITKQQILYALNDLLDTLAKTCTRAYNLEIATIGPGNIIEMDGELFIKMITQKTKEEVIIPCNPIVLSMFKKYEQNANKLPKTISSQKFNDYIKDACKDAGFTGKGRLSSSPDKELWECVSSHTARRSFATNLYLDGFPSHEIMKITGHRSESSFKKYIKVDKLQTAKRLSDHNKKKNWSSLLMKVAS